MHGRYVAALEREIKLRRHYLDGCGPVRTIYFGGGTPSLLRPEEFIRIYDALAAAFDLSGVEEFTVEVNPEDIAGEGGLTEAYRRCGVNRISMGVQSFCDAHLKWMNRRHTAATALRAFEKLRAAGFDNISIDLIFGFAGLTDSDWRATLRQAVALAPEHISAYQMSIDPESALAERLAAGRYSELSDETCAAQYALLQDTLEAAGYEQYEISNFCLPGRHSRHNSAYWDRTAYLGLGPAAHSFDGSARRSWNPSDTAEYCAALEVGRKPEEGSENLSEADIYNERIMLGLRTARGVPKALIDPDKARHSLAAGILKETEDAYRIPRDKFFICDSIIEEFLLT